MHPSHHVKPIFVLLVLTINMFGALYCMENPTIDPKKLSYLPTEAPDNQELNALRKKITDATPENIQSLCPCIDIVKIEKPWQRKGVCFRVALKESLGLTKKEIDSLRTLCCEELVGRELNILNDYYKQTNYPHAGSLAVYCDGTSIEHLGIVVPDGRIKSKLGTGTGIYIHPLWALPDIWGNEAFFFDLKNKFIGEKGKNIVLSDLLNKINKSSTIPRQFITVHTDLIDACSTKSSSRDFRNYTRVYNLLKMCPTIDINATDSTQTTPLMLAAQKGTLNIVVLLTTHKAALNTQNNEGKTALKLAAENNHFIVVWFLRDHGADRYILDSNGNKIDQLL